MEVLFVGSGPRDYASAIRGKGSFDVVIVDGASNRYLCAKEALRHLNPGGMVILDNSEWYPKSAAMLREAGNLIQADFYGFKATESHTSTTSVFFHREYKNIPRAATQPTLMYGQIKVSTDWDSEPKQPKARPPAKQAQAQAEEPLTLTSG